MDIRSNVKKLCSLHGITQKQLAEKIGISDSAMNINLGRKNPKLMSILRIADALGVSMDLVTAENIDEALAAAAEQEHKYEEPRQGIFCPHCGKPLTLFVRAEGPAGQEQ